MIDDLINITNSNILLNLSGCDNYVACGEINAELHVNFGDCSEINADCGSAILTPQTLQNVEGCFIDGALLVSDNTGNLTYTTNECKYDVESSNKREMERELKEMDMLIANKNFPFESDMLMDIPQEYLEEVCRKIHNMKWVVTTGMDRIDYENTLCVKYDCVYVYELSEYQKQLMLDI